MAEIVLSYYRIKFLNIVFFIYILNGEFILKDVVSISECGLRHLLTCDSKYLDNIIFKTKR